MNHPIRTIFVPLIALSFVFGCSRSNKVRRSFLPQADELSARTMRGSGAQHLPKVKRIRFTVIQESDTGRYFPVTHDYEPATEVDTVSWLGKSVTVRPGVEATTDDERQALAFAREHTFALLAPLKLFDELTTRALLSPQTIGGRTYETLQVSFARPHPRAGETYRLYVNAPTGKLWYWDVIPPGGVPSGATRYAWENYQVYPIPKDPAAASLTLATERKSLTSSHRIRFTDVTITPADAPTNPQR